MWRGYYLAETLHVSLKKPVTPLPPHTLENPTFLLGRVPKNSLSHHRGSVALSPCRSPPRPAAGFMTQDERKKFESLHSDFNKYWVPCVWFTNLAAQARRDGRIRDDVALRLLMDVSGAGSAGGTAPRGGTPGENPSLSSLPGAERVPGQVQHAVPLRLDQHPAGVHAGGRPDPPKKGFMLALHPVPPAHSDAQELRADGERGTGGIAPRGGFGI